MFDVVNFLNKNQNTLIFKMYWKMIQGESEYMVPFEIYINKIMLGQHL